MQALQRHKQNAGTLAVARQVYRDHGLAGFFKGLMPSMVMVVNPTIQYILYESLVARALELRRCGITNPQQLWRKCRCRLLETHCTATAVVIGETHTAALSGSLMHV
jgi:hypothetical protein